MRALRAGLAALAVVVAMAAASSFAQGDVAPISEPTSTVPVPADLLPQPEPPPVVPPQGPRLAVYGGLDFYGHDIAKGHRSDLASCASDCQSNGQCKAFTFNADPAIHIDPNCFLKDGVDRLEAYSTALAGEIIPPGNDPPTYTFDAIDLKSGLLPNTDLPGNDLSQTAYRPATDVDACRMACISNSECAAFSFVSRLKQCWLKDSAGSARSASGIISGIKRRMSIAPQRVVNLPP